MKEVEDQVCDTLSKLVIRRKTRLSDGEFQPLTYWTNIGYDGALIVANTPDEDRKWHPQLGETFRVVIHKTSTGQITDNIRAKVLKRKAPKGKLSLLAAAGETKPSAGQQTASVVGSDESSDDESRAKRRKQRAEKKEKEAAKAALQESKKLESKRKLRRRRRRRQRTRIPTR